MTNPAPGALARHDLGITPFWAQAAPKERRAQREWLRALTAAGDTELADDVFISRLAAVYTDRLRVGARSYVCGYAVLYGDVEMGEDCTVNPYAEARGLVRLGDGVRVGAHASILGFNHGTSPDESIHRQPLTRQGIAIGADVWIGSHAVVLDGVTVGDHCIVGAGAVVTKDVPAWSVVVGNPARVVRDRNSVPSSTRRSGADLGDRLVRLADTAREQARDLLDRCWTVDGYVDRPGVAPTLRAWCDAVELSDLLLGGPPPHVPAERVVELLRSRQSAATGLAAELGSDDAEPTADGHAPANYHVLAAGNALRLLGSGFEHPVASVAALTSNELRHRLDTLPWRRDAWRSGAWIDTVGTAMLWNRADFGLDTELEALIGWLVTRCDPASGLWGRPAPDSGWLEPVNGSYRLIRGTFAQYGVPLPYPERTVDTVLAHAGDATWFGPHRGTACNVLDVVHPLWLAARQSAHRRADGEAWARRQLERVLNSWRDGAGFAFALEPGSGWQRTPGLLGTEMWLAIIWFVADHLGIADALGYRPRGVHRPEPMTTAQGER
ncbi:acyltransferase [Jiangella asiatica]|uniref:acyltransferase n=1 Tax=Jiangella asiatica TaxID=2530372 RepID=UPI0023AF3C16|nr:acyltransferase [Jiangella asiatica]